MSKEGVSKAYREGGAHVGWKKSVGGRSWFLIYGTSPADEAKAIALGQALEAKWSLCKLAGATELSQADFDEVKALVEGRPKHTAHQPPAAQLVRPADVPQTVNGAATMMVEVPSPATLAIAPSPAPASPRADGQPRRWLYAAIDEFISTMRRNLKPDGSNGDTIANLIDNINRAREAIADVPLDSLRRKELDDWLLSIRVLPSKFTGKPLGAVRVRNLAQAVRAAVTCFAKWDWWVPPVLWETAFDGYTIKKLETPTERKKRKSLPPAHMLDEKRVLWNLALPSLKAYMALADWAGHTQKEIATLTFDEIKEEAGGMYIDRDRHKTGVHGRWWIPPEAAAFIRARVAQTPSGKEENPNQLAFLSPRGMPLVHRSLKGKGTRSDYIGNNLWPALLRCAANNYVKHVSFKYMRKATSQLIRDAKGKEVSRTFLAHADEDVQDEAYNRACVAKVERIVRKLYARRKVMFMKIAAAEWDTICERIREQNGFPAEMEPAN